MTGQAWKRAAVQYGGLLGVVVVLLLVFGLTSDNFLRRSTMISIANQIPDLTFIAVGMTLVLICGGIDLSVGSQLALASAVLGVLMTDFRWPLWAAVPVSLFSGSLCGLWNGVVSAAFRIPSFIVTLGMLEIARGTTKVLTDSQSLYLGSSVEWFGVPLSGIPVSPAFLLAVGTVLAGQFLLTQTVFGRYCVAIGTSEETVRLSGIRSWPVLVSVFVISGILCGLAGLAQTARLSTVDPNAAVGLELAAIAACVIGGTSLMGGRGSVIGSFFGVLIIAVLQTGLAHLGVSDASKQIITGCVIVAAVFLDALRTHFRSNGA